MASASGKRSGGRGGSGDGGGGGESGMFSRDVAWKYCSPVEGNLNGIICNFCGLLMKRRDISQFKFHLAHRDSNNNTKKCPKVPLEVKEEIQEMLNEKSKAKTKKIAHIEEIQIQLCGTMGARHKHVMDKGDDEDDEVYMYQVDMHPDE
ncbi:hypothetical protein CK203_070574 [Vitis vinifera]|uniref:Uncharacterized protein n=1 Tax=Vitis vinifera TaxID=29760 RepID=A0A438FAL1_VITVI|nr:hypothetical protein CK203_070574 [Vitis vinifera]